MRIGERARLLIFKNFHSPLFSFLPVLSFLLFFLFFLHFPLLRNKTSKI